MLFTKSNWFVKASSFAMGWPKMVWMICENKWGILSNIWWTWFECTSFPHESSSRARPKAARPPPARPRTSWLTMGLASWPGCTWCRWPAVKKDLRRLPVLVFYHGDTFIIAFVFHMRLGEQDQELRGRRRRTGGVAGWQLARRWWSADRNRVKKETNRFLCNGCHLWLFYPQFYGEV
jgi:hypothetical protein